MSRWNLAGFAALLALVLTADLGVAQESGPAAIKLRMTTFVPALGQLPQIPDQLRIAGYGAGVRGYYLLQFAAPIDDARRAQLQAQGVDILEYVPDLAYKVRMTPAVAVAVGQQAGVTWVGLFQPAFKLSPDLARDGLHLYKVRIEAGADVGLARSDIQLAGAQLISGNGNVVVISANSAQLDAVARVLDVAWVENFKFREKHNEYGAGVIVGSASANALGYDGSGQIVAVADTGFGGGTAATGHVDVPASRIVAINNWTAPNSLFCYNVLGNGAKDEDSGHGTHVAMSVLGEGDDSGHGRGAAPAAKLLFQAIEEYVDFTGFCALQNPDGYYLIGIPDDFRPLFQQAYDGGARIHSNSWGSAAAGDYTIDSANVDDFIWNHRDMTITYSAGNEGTDANSDGVIDNDSIGSPATAKNVVTVGASENDRKSDNPCDTALTYITVDNPAQTTCSQQGGQNLLRVYGQAWPSDFPAEPYKSDPVAGNAEQMAGFSSRGPTDDGRIKPDVVAPGTYILSGYSDLHQQQYDNTTNQAGRTQHDGWVYPMDRFYKYFGGTSMSNPITAGSAAVLRDFYQTTDAHSASAALIKATLINSAEDLLDENNDGANDNDFPIPNNHEGWGRVDLINATDGSAKYVDNTTGIGTGATATQSPNVAAGTPLKVTLVWSDAPSTEAAATNLVNDLDLVVTAPGGAATYRGNVFSGGWSQTGGSADRKNNVENVYVQSPTAGTWTVQVSGFNVPNGPQPFALVMDYAPGNTSNNPPTANNDSYNTTEDTALNVAAPGVLGNDSDPDSNPLTAVLASNAAKGNVTLNSNGSFTYTPNANANGSDSFTYRANDGTANSAPATVTINVAAVNDAPVGSADSYSVAMNGNLVVGAPGVLGNDTDADGNSLTAVQIGGPAHGSVSLNANGGFTYTPAGGYSGPDSFTYAPNDGTVNGNTTTVSITVQSAATTMHVGDLDRSSTSQGNRWTAFVTITVHNSNEAAVANATVSGNWSNGATGSAQCTTNAGGQCTVSKSGILRLRTSVTFTVSGVSASGLTYSSAANHDPDGDSNGTTITVARP